MNMQHELRGTRSPSPRPLRPALVLLALVVGPSACVAPFSDLQSAGTLAAGQTEITGSYSYVQFSDDDRRDKVQDDLGLQVARGLTEWLELRSRYDLITIEDEVEEQRVSTVGLGPKFALVPDRLAFYAPVGFGFGSDIDTSETWMVQPTVLFTVPLGSTLEVTTSGKAQIWVAAEDLDDLLAFNLGLGISDDLARWAIRPEVGFLINPGEEGAFWHFSIGLSTTRGGDR